MLRRPCQLTLVVAALLVAAGLSACGRRAANGPAGWDALRDRFLAGQFEMFPDLAVYVGKHAFDGRLPDWSPGGLTRTIASLHRVRDEAAAVTDQSLDEARRFERDYLLAVVDRQLFWIERADAPHRNPDFYVSNNPVGPALSPDVYVTRNYAPPADRLRAYIAWAKAVPRAVEQARANLRPPLQRPMIDIGRLRFGGMASYLAADVPLAFRDVTDTALLDEFRSANEAAAAAFRDMDAWLESQRSTQTETFALGADRVAEMLRATERVDVPLERLEQIGRDDLARNVAALREACGVFAAGSPLDQCVERAGSHKPAESVVAAATRQLYVLEAFVRSHDLVTIPGPERALVRESPPYQRGNFAYIDTPGPFEKGLPAIFYVAPPDPAWSEADQHAYIPSDAHLLFTSAHEVWPGHFLHSLHSNRIASPIGRVFVGYAFAEGWAHYCEEMMWDAGLGNQNPEVHIGQIVQALQRDGRFLSALGLHTGTMTEAESERLFRNEAFQDAGTSRQQAARGTYDPAYLNYTLGKLMIRKLRDDWTATRGGRSAWKAFHDAFLQYGGPPIPLVRKALGVSGDPL